jgi:hypothetical protein
LSIQKDDLFNNIFLENYIAICNNYFTKIKGEQMSNIFEEFEKQVGGFTKAAELAGVNPSTWYRWREGQMGELYIEKARKLVRLLMEEHKRKEVVNG